jgi:hypothetical protein
MATLDECRAALERLAQKLSSVEDTDRRQHAFDRSVSCLVPDLQTTFSGQLRDGHIVGITTEPAPRAQIRLTADSDDLVALTDGRVSFGQAWLSGKVKVQAGVMDLLKLKSMV